jgi:hypothetical protein
MEIVLMCNLLEARDVIVGFHPEGYRIDKSASALNRYTQWKIATGNHWCDPKPVCFHSLPDDGWIAVDKFDWNMISDSLNQDI